MHVGEIIWVGRPTQEDFGWNVGSLDGVRESWNEKARRGIGDVECYDEQMRERLDLVPIG